VEKPHRWLGGILTSYTDQAAKPGNAIRPRTNGLSIFFSHEEKSE